MKLEYPYLPKGRKIEYVDMSNVFMSEAKNIAIERSTDQRQPIGSVIVKDDKVIGKGANQSGFKNKKLIEWHRQFLCSRKILQVPSGKKYWICPGCADNSKHSERQAIKDAKRNGESCEGADVYLWGHWWCCESCWGGMIDEGIKNVYLLKNSEVLFNRNNTKNILPKN